MTRTPRPISIVLLVFVASCIYLSSCTKTGPQGPAGVTGAAGAQGSIGSTGPQGNANVWVDTFTLVSSDWLFGSEYEYSYNANNAIGNTTRYHVRAFSKITQDILNTGVVMVYFNANFIVTDDWQPLNYSIEFGAYYYLNLFYQPSLGQVQLNFFFSANGTAAIPDQTTLKNFDIAPYKFKIVAISGTISTGMKRAGVDTRDYKSVSTFLGM